MTEVVVTFRVNKITKIRPSKATLRKQLKDRRLTREQRCRAYSYLMYRRLHGLR